MIIFFLFRFACSKCYSSASGRVAALARAGGPRSLARVGGPRSLARVGAPSPFGFPEFMRKALGVAPQPMGLFW